MWNQFESNMQSDAGFMDDSRIGSADEEKKGKRADNLVPVMIGHILQIGPELHLYGNPVRVVEILAIIRNIDHVTTKVTYTVEDETGTMKAIKWNSADEEAEAREQMFDIGTYVHVFGLPREQDGEKHILILRICPMKELNELTCHLLQVLYVSQSGTSSQSSIKKAASVGDTSYAMESSDMPGMDKDQCLVFSIIKNDISESGIERSDIKSKVPSHIVGKVDDILEFLAGEGHIYTTRTDNHFKAT